jgi:hypothetical protein
LDLVIWDNNSLEVTKCSFPLFSKDLAQPPLRINGPIIVSTLISTTAFTEFNFQWADNEAMNVHFNYYGWDFILCGTLSDSVII